jgi:hypothetical protein
MSACSFSRWCYNLGRSDSSVLMRVIFFSGLQWWSTSAVAAVFLAVRWLSHLAGDSPFFVFSFCVLSFPSLPSLGQTTTSVDQVTLRFTCPYYTCPQVSRSRPLRRRSPCQVFASAPAAGDVHRGGFPLPAAGYLLCRSGRPVVPFRRLPSLQSHHSLGRSPSPLSAHQ